MTTVTVDVIVLEELHVHRCPLCGAVLDPDWDDVLCPVCDEDEAEKLADLHAEKQQAWFPY